METDQATSNPQDTEVHQVNIDGELHNVSIDELKSGYQRQADYTRKTQELSRERERLAQGEAIVQALESDPEAAISALGSAFGMEMGNQNTTPQGNLSDEYGEDLDPDEIRLRKLEQNLEEHNRALRQQNLQKEVNGLRDKYNDDFDDQKLFTHALKNNIPNLEAAYTHMTYGDMLRAKENGDIVQDKRDAQVIDSSTGTASGNLEPRATQAINSIRDAYELAKQETN